MIERNSVQSFWGWFRFQYNEIITPNEVDMKRYELLFVMLLLMVAP